jgi:predicted unusual protein kinase regulating ubiquinone biosynthesis (AarF/ABC1/UbiB family)
MPPRYRELVFNAGVLKTVARLHLWLWGAFRFGRGLFVLWLFRRNTDENRACLLRETISKMGPTFIKLGQQLSMRLDLLPYPYTSELEKLLDDLDAFDTETALQVVERAVGQSRGVPLVPREQIFSAFDQKAIGAASVACVYHAVLKTGEHVAVKVRRPGIGQQFAADLRALKWVLSIFEVFGLPPGFLKNFHHELKSMLMDELDFRKEARFAELYSRKTRKTKQMRFISVPRVFFDYSNDEVLIADFVSGVWLKDILSALTTNEGQMRELLSKMNIDPIILARRIQLIARYNNFENIFFHADLHPANILVQPGNRICLIDFGSCGSFSRRELNAWRRWFDAQSVDDVGGMVQAALAIIEPVPAIDKDEFGQRLETEFWKNLYAIKSKHAEWSERISSRLWLDFLKLCREFNIPMRLNTLRMIRASLLTDTIAGRLDHDQDPYREFRYYEKGAGKRAKKRTRKRVKALLGPSKFIRIEQGLESTLQLLFQIQRTVNSLAGIRIGALITKLSYFLSLFLKHAAWILSTAIVATFAMLLLHWFNFKGLSSVGLPNLGILGPRYTQIQGPVSALHAVVTNPVWQLIAAAPTVLVMLRVYLRLGEKHYPRGSSSRDDM